MPPKKKPKGFKGKKKGKKKKEKIEEEIPDRSVFDREIADLNAYLAALRSRSLKLQSLNEELERKNVKLGEDEIDIVAYLNRTLRERSEEIDLYQKQLQEIEEEMVETTAGFEEQMERIQEEFRVMEEQLQAEVKMLYGKLHALEEFRLQRDDLMRKYEVLERDTEEQEIRHKREIYTVEKKFIIGKDKLKKEMEAKLKWLASEFQNITDIRVASTTHKVIKANIALNKKLDQELQNQKDLHVKNENLKKRDMTLRLNQELNEEESRILKRTVDKQNERIEKLSLGYRDMQQSIHNLKSAEKEFKNCIEEISKIQREIVELTRKHKILEQNIHKIRCDRVELESEIKTEEKCNQYLYKTLKEISLKIENTINEEQDENPLEEQENPLEDEDLEISKKSHLFYQLSKLLKELQQWSWSREEAEKLDSRSDIYMPGKLGLIPMKVVFKSEKPVMKVIAVQVDGSYSDILVSHPAEIPETEQSLEQLENEEEYESLQESLMKVSMSLGVHSSTTSTSKEIIEEGVSEEYEI